MIKSFRHRGLKLFFETGAVAGIHVSDTDALRQQLGFLDVATCPGEMDLPGFGLHLVSDVGQRWGVLLSPNSVLTFAFNGIDVIAVDLSTKLEIVQNGKKKLGGKSNGQATPSRPHY